MTEIVNEALDYRERGWCPIPLRAGAKVLALAGVTGYNGIDLDEGGIRKHFAKPGVGLALRMPAGVMGLDVDQYGEKLGADALAELCEELGVTLPPTWSSTARGPATAARIYFFRCPPGSYAGQACKAVEVIQRSHRYAVAAPTIHPKVGAPYAWYGPDGEEAEAPPYVDELPELPGALSEYLFRSDKTDVRPELADDELNAWMDRYARPDDWKARALLRKELADGFDIAGSLHDQAITKACFLARDAAAGHYDARAAFNAGQDAWEAARSARAAVGGRVPPSEEWWSCVRWGAAQAEPDVATRAEARGDEVPETPAAPVPLVYLRDDHMGEALAKWLDTSAIMVGGIGWMTWNGARYERDEEGTAVPAMAVTFAREVVAAYEAEADRLSASGASDDMVKDARKDVRKAELWCQTGKRNNLVLDAARMMGTTPAEDLDAAPHLLNVANGIVDLRSGELIDHDPAYLMTKLADAEYRPGHTTADWDKALGALSEDLAAYVQEAMGATVMATSRADMVLVAVGDGGNGKSTIIGSSFSVLGDYAVALGANVVMGEGHRPQELMPLRGARLALVSETAADHYLNAERVKALSGGDPITDRYLYARSSLTWYPSHVIWMQTNHRPRIKDNDNGIWRRLRPVPFTTSFVGDPDEGLKDRLRLDPANRSAVLTWIVKGAQIVSARGSIHVPTSVLRYAATWRDEESVVAKFMADAGYYYTGSLDDRVTCDEVREAYVAWTGRNGYHAANAGTMGKMLADQAKVSGKAFDHKRLGKAGTPSRTNYYLGIGKGHSMDSEDSEGAHMDIDFEGGTPW